MENIIVNNKIETVGSDKNIVDIIKENCGYEFADFIEQRLNKPIEISQNLIDKILSESDYYTYEKSLDNHNCIFNDILDECENQIEYIQDSKRIDKQKLCGSFNKILNIVSEEI